MTATNLFSAINQKENIISDKALVVTQSWLSNTKVSDQTIIEDDNAYFSSEEDGYTNAICACGKVLSAGWNCNHCRCVCSTCHRALTPEEECSRCTHPSSP